jgi:hypothetical protein
MRAAVRPSPAMARTVGDLDLRPEDSTGRYRGSSQWTTPNAWKRPAAGFVQAVLGVIDEDGTTDSASLIDDIVREGARRMPAAARNLSQNHDP